MLHEPATIIPPPPKARAPYFAQESEAWSVFTHVVLYFFAYATLGWFWETAYCSLVDGHFEDRGFLNGPYCPVYGFAIITVLYLIHPFFKKRAVVIFVMSAIVATSLEYFSGVVLEKVFHTRLWDYGAFPLNFQGIICAPAAIFWGLGCVFLVKVLHPHVKRAADAIYARSGIALPVIITIAMFADFLLTITNTLEIKQDLGAG